MTKDSGPKEIETGWWLPRAEAAHLTDIEPRAINANQKLEITHLKR